MKKSDKIIYMSDFKKAFFRITLLFIAYCIVIVNIVGCEAIMRKFTRKPKEKEPEEPVLVFEEYAVEKLDKETAYKNYYNFWKSWHSDLINTLNTAGNSKRYVLSIEQAVINLEKMMALLCKEKQDTLKEYIDDLTKIKEDFMNQKLSNALVNRVSNKLKRLKRKIFNKYHFNKVKECIK